MREICKPDELAAIATRLLRESLPDSLKAALRDALAAGATKPAIYARVLRQAGGQRTLTVLAIEEFLGMPE